MELLSNDDMMSKEMETDESTDDQQMAEAELCKTYGYELAMSPADTKIPDDDLSWISEDSTDSQATSLKMTTEDFDLLEPFLFESGSTYKHHGKVSELYWFSDESYDSQTSIVKTCTEDFDQLETTLFSSTEPTAPFIDLTVDVDSQPDEGKSNDSANSEGNQHVLSEKYIAETTILVKSLAKRMTLGQKMKFYGWFNSGLSIEEAALKSKIPDLIPPPVRHPDCKLSKKRLRRLSKILPNVFMQRQFVNEAYFFGVDPKQVMRYLLMDLGSENLIATFECQFALEEYAAAKEKILRHEKRDRTATDAPAAAPASVQQRSNPDIETGMRELNFEIEHRRIIGLKLKNQATGEKLPRGNMPYRTAADDDSPIFELIFATKENPLREDTREATAAGADALATIKQPPNSDLEVGTGEPSSKTHTKETSGFRLKGDKLKKFYFWHKRGLSAHEAASVAMIHGPDQDIAPHPNCQHSWEKLQLLAKALPNRNSRERFLVEAYYAGKDPGEVLKDILSGKNDSPESIQVAESGSGGESHTFPDNATTGTSFVAEEALVTKPYALPELVIGTKAIDTSADADTGKSVADLERSNKSKPRLSRVKRNDGENELQAEKMSKERQSSNGFKSADPKHKVDPVLELHSNGGHSETPRMSLNQLKKYYKWRNQGSSHSEALVKAQTLGLIPKSIPHPGCKYSVEEVKDMSDAISKKHKRLMFQIEVFYGGKKPEDVMKKILSSYQEDASWTSNPTADSLDREISNQSIEYNEFSLGDRQLEQEPSRLEQAKSDHTSLVDDKPVNEDSTELSKLGCKQLKNYYRWRDSGLSFSEALLKARIPGMLPKTKGPHPDCKYSLEEVKEMASTLPTRSSRYRYHFEVYYRGKDPSEVLKQMKTEVPPASKPNVQNGGPSTMPLCLQNGTGAGKIESGEMSGGAQPVLENTISVDTPSRTKSATDSFDRKMSDRSISRTELSHAEVGPHLHQSPSRLEQAKSGRISSVNDRQLDFFHHTVEEIKAMASALPTKSLRYKFQFEVFHRGKDPNELLKHMITEVPQASEPKCPNVPNAARGKSAMLNVSGGKGNFAILHSAKNGSDMASFVQNGMDIDNPASGEMTSVRPAFRYTISEENDDSMCSDSVLELSNYPLKKYCAWRNKGLSHDAALLKAHSKHGNLSGREVNEFYVAHRNCKYSRDELKQLSLKLTSGWARERFFILAFFGGMDPARAIKLLKRTPLPNGGLTLGRSQKRLMKRVQIKYLMGKGLNRKDALKLMRNPSENLMKELKDVIQIYCTKIKADENHPNLAASRKISLSSPYHPSKLLSDDRLKKYYLWISKGYSRGDAFRKALNGEPVPQDMHDLHHLRSKYNLEEVKKMSKDLTNEVLAKKFIIEVFYGQSDPHEVMEFMSQFAKSVEPHQDVCQDIEKNPWFPSKKVQDVHNLPDSAEVAPAVAPVFVDGLGFPLPALEHELHSVGQSYGSIGVADTPTIVSPFQVMDAGTTMASALPTMAADLTTMACSGYTQPPDVCSPIEQQDVNNSVYLVDSPTQTHSSSILRAQHPALGNSQVECFIVPVDFPNEILTEPQMDAIENSVLEAILEMDDDDTKPSFTDSFRSSGRYGIICNDEFSVDWLYKYLRVYEPWEGALLRLITSNSNKIRANAVLPLCKGDDDDKILKFIGKQNFGLSVDKWAVFQRWDSSDGTYMNLVIDEESAEILLKSSRISFKMGSADIITAQRDSSNHITDSPKNPPASPLHPSSPPPAPSPPSPQPCMIDTSLGALLKSSASKSCKDRPQKVHNDSDRRHRDDGTSRSSSPESIRGKRRSRKDQSLRERKRPRSSSLDQCGRLPRNYLPRAPKVRRSEKDCKRSASKSISQDHEKKRRKFRKNDPYGSRSPSPERLGSKGRKKHSWLDWFYPGGKKRSPERSLRNPKRAPPRSTSPCSFISSEDNLSFPDDSCRSSLPSCPSRASSVENTEYAQYLGNSPLKPSSDVFVDLTGSP